jgi:hypothetical protein
VGSNPTRDMDVCDYSVCVGLCVGRQADLLAMETHLLYIYIYIYIIKKLKKRSRRNKWAVEPLRMIKVVCWTASVV